MFKTNKGLWLIAILVLAMLVFAACTPQDGNVDNPDDGNAVTEENTITDMAGREVTLPDEISKVYTHAQMSTIMVYTLAPDMLLGWNYELNDMEKAYILEEYQDLPAFGMGDAVNHEAIIAAGPQIAIIAGTIDERTIADADDLQLKLGIPVVIIDGSIDKSAEAYRFLGEVLNIADAAEPLAVYAETALAWVNDKVSALAEEDKATVYYGNGAESLNTAPAGSSSAQVLDMIGVINVAQVEVGSSSRIDVSKEQIISWNPDVVFLNGEPKEDYSANAAVEDFISDPDFATVNAVINAKVYASPKAPFSWIDRPPGPNRLIGLYWSFATIYPEQADLDIDATIKDFYQLFYHMDLTDEQMQVLMQS